MRRKIIALFTVLEVHRVTVTELVMKSKED